MKTPVSTKESRKQKADQAARDSLANKAHQEFKVYDVQVNEYSRDVKLGLTPEADAKPYSYTARNGQTYTGEQSLLNWGYDLREIIREAEKGTLDPNESLPVRPKGE